MNIKDFFKPFARPQPQTTKRPAPERDIGDSEPPRKSRSRTPTRSLGPDSEPDYKFADATSPKYTSAPSSLLSEGRDRIHAATQSDRGQGLDGPTIADEELEGKQERLREAMDSARSQSPLLASSQRIVKHGEVMIRNSDDEESDSDSSLGDIEDLLRARKQPDPVTSSPLTEQDSSSPSVTDRSSPEAIGRTRRQTKAIASTNAPGYRSTLPPQPKYKFDIGTLVQRSVKNETSEAMMSKARRTLESLEERDALRATEVGEGSRKSSGIDAGLITSAFKGRGEANGVERLMMAIQRTEALQQEKSWSFFLGDDEALCSEHAALPMKHLGHGAALFRDTSSRQQAFLGGYVSDMASNGRLPNDIILWLFDAACFESREDLRHAYGYSVKHATTQIMSLFTPDRINVLFGKVGAGQTALDPKHEIVPTARTPTNTEGSPSRPRLLSLLSLIRDIASSMNVEARRHSICLLCRMLIDRCITQNACTIVRVEDTLEMLVTSLSDDTAEQELEIVLATLFLSIRDVSLQSRLIHNIPASSLCLSLFRRRLALAFFFDDASYLSKEAGKLINLTSISHELTQPGYAIGKETDYAELAASLSMLGIGVDNGDPPPAGFNMNAEKGFDEAIDMVAREIKSLNDRIVDTGASHMRRTQAKQVLQGFHSRLIYAIRLKPQPKINVFGSSSQDDEASKQASFMRKHLMSNAQITSPS